jgi:membrane protein required for beta-lactamase induction
VENGGIEVMVVGVERFNHLDADPVIFEHWISDAHHNSAFASITHFDIPYCLGILVLGGATIRSWAVAMPCTLCTDLI